MQILATMAKDKVPLARAVLAMSFLSGIAHQNPNRIRP
jgi:hypothetical protein